MIFKSTKCQCKQGFRWSLNDTIESENLSRCRQSVPQFWCCCPKSSVTTSVKTSVWDWQEVLEVGSEILNVLMLMILMLHFLGTLITQAAFWKKSAVHAFPVTEWLQCLRGLLIAHVDGNQTPDCSNWTTVCVFVCVYVCALAVRLCTHGTFRRTDALCAADVVRE